MVRRGENLVTKGVIGALNDANGRKMVRLAP